MSTESGEIALFRHYPGLASRMPRVPLGEFPTPVRGLDGLGSDGEAGRLYIKRDDLAGRVYGGNKLRKLEFILGRVLESGARDVLTFGFPGFKHHLVTAVCARQVGLKCICMMLPDAGGALARRNLLAELRFGAELHQQRNLPLLLAETACVLARRGLRTGRLPRLVRGSQSSSLGTVGYVNAAFELRDQVSRGEAPEPDLVYVPLGTMGTAVGLALGFKASGMRSRVVAVRAADEAQVGPERIARLFEATVRRLRSADPSFPRVDLARGDLDVRHDYYGRLHSLDGRAQEARSRILSAEGIELDPHYTEKSLDCLLEDREKGQLRDRVALFWNTFDSRDMSDIIAGVDYRELPRSFHRYFEDGAGSPGGH
jgi:1-aminocyclopropane-1-carboxylate deaminase/D-cysteine desulfhydrase-like pyridoxal-dependent ACC family enzyme